MLNNAPHRRTRKLLWTHRLVEKFWNGLSESGLLDHLSFSRLAGHWLLQILDPYLAKDKRILDFGAGDGDFSKLLLKAGYQTAVYEPSAARAEILQSRLGNESGFLGIIGPDNEEKFDIITLIEVIEHILEEDMNHFLKTLDRLLAHNGMLIITTPNNEDLFLNSVLDPVSGNLFHRWQHQRSFTDETLNACLAQQSFSSLTIHKVELTDQVFSEYGAGLGTNPAFSNFLRAHRSLRIGNENQLIWIGQRKGELRSEPDFPVLSLKLTNKLITPDHDFEKIDDIQDTTSKKLDVYCYSLIHEHIKHDDGFLYSTELPNEILASDRLGLSQLVIYEDGRRLGPSAALHADLRLQGGGGYSHWGKNLFFTSSDGTDPRNNGRSYSIYMRHEKNDNKSIFTVSPHSIEILDTGLYKIFLPHFIPFTQTLNSDGGFISMIEDHLPLIETHGLDTDILPGYYKKYKTHVVFRPNDGRDPRHGVSRYRIVYLA